MNFLKVENLIKNFYLGDNIVHALQGISLSIDKGEFVAITGASGSGKSTFMHLLGCLDKPTDGKYFIEGEEVSKLTSNQLAKIRNQKIGFVFQKFHLLPDLTALENVALPQLYAGLPEKDALNNASYLLDRVGLDRRKRHHPFQLSGGQQQRVAIARALINKPSILLADEPTGNLDSQSGQAILDILKELNLKYQVTIILVTHEPSIAKQTQRITELRDGKIISDKTTEDKKD